VGEHVGGATLLCESAVRAGLKSAKSPPSMIDPWIMPVASVAQLQAA
jgi:hypothetical protein